MGKVTAGTSWVLGGLKARARKLIKAINYSAAQGQSAMKANRDASVNPRD